MPALCSSTAARITSTIQLQQRRSMSTAYHVRFCLFSFACHIGCIVLFTGWFHRCIRLEHSNASLMHRWNQPVNKTTHPYRHSFVSLVWRLCIRNMDVRPAVCLKHITYRNSDKTNPELTAAVKKIAWCSVPWLSGRTLVFDRRAFAVLRSTYSWRVTTSVNKPSAIGQPTRLTQLFILLESINQQ